MSAEVNDRSQLDPTTEDVATEVRLAAKIDKLKAKYHEMKVELEMNKIALSFIQSLLDGGTPINLPDGENIQSMINDLNQAIVEQEAWIRLVDMVDVKLLGGNLA